MTDTYSLGLSVDQELITEGIGYFHDFGGPFFTFTKSHILLVCFTLIIYYSTIEQLNTTHLIIITTLIQPYGTSSRLLQKHQHKHLC